MSNQVTEQRGPPFSIYALAIVLAVPSGYLAPWPWHSEPSLLGAGLAAGGAIIGVFLRATVVEAIVLSAIIGWVIAMLPKSQFVTAIVVPAAVGLIVGKFVVGVWGEIRGGVR